MHHRKSTSLFQQMPKHWACAFRRRIPHYRSPDSAPPGRSAFLAHLQAAELHADDHSSNVMRHHIQQVAFGMCNLKCLVAPARKSCKQLQQRNACAWRQPSVRPRVESTSLKRTSRMANDQNRNQGQQGSGMGQQGSGQQDQQKMGQQSGQQQRQGGQQSGQGGQQGGLQSSQDDQDSTSGGSGSSGSSGSTGSSGTGSQGGSRQR
jgi:hypothetical protein